MDKLIFERLSKLRGDARKALLDAAQDVALGSADPEAQRIAQTVLEFAGAA